MIQCHDTPLGCGQRLCQILSRSNMVERSNSLETDSSCVCTWTLTLILDQGHDLSWGHGQQLSQLLLRSNMAVSMERSYCQEKDFSYVHTLTFEI